MTLDQYLTEVDTRINRLVHLRELLRNARELYELELIPVDNAVTIRDSFVTAVRTVGSELATEVTID